MADGWRMGGGWMARVPPPGTDTPRAEAGSCSSPLCARRVVPRVGMLGCCGPSFRLAWPVTVTNLLFATVAVTNLGFVGAELNTTELAAAGLAVSYTSVFGVSVGAGLSTALDTLCSQAHGAGDELAGRLALHRGFLLLGGAMVPCFALWLSAQPFLTSLGYEHETARLVGRFLRVSMPMLPGSYSFVLLQKYLNARGVVLPFVAIGGVVNVANVFLNWLLVVRQQRGLDGSAAVLVLSNWCFVGCTVVYMWWAGLGSGSLWRWSPRCLDRAGCRDFVALALPGMCMVCIEWWSFEICQFLAGMLGTTDLATQVVLQSLASWTFMIPLGVSVAASIRVGNLLGADDGARAKQAAEVAIRVVAGAGVCFGLLYVALRRQLTRPFTDDADVRALAARCGVVIAVFQLFDFVQAACSGVLRGCGRQLLGAKLNLLGYWVLGIPIGAAVAFAGGLGVIGLWLGLAISLSVQASCMLYAIIHSDWARYVWLAGARARNEGAARGRGGDHDGADDDDPLVEDA